jgi:hypothetical protein
MVLLYGTMLAGIVLLCIQYLHLRTIYNRQVTESRFRKLHNEATDMLFEGVFIHKNLSDSDLLLLRHIVGRLKQDILQLKTNLKKYFTLINYLRLSIEGRRLAERHPEQYAQAVQVYLIQRKAGEAMSDAFQMLVPWLHFRILYVLMRLGLYLLVLIGMQQFRAMHEQIQVSGRQRFSHVH